MRKEPSTFLDDAIKKLRSIQFSVIADKIHLINDEKTKKLANELYKTALKEKKEIEGYLAKPLLQEYVMDILACVMMVFRAYTALKNHSVSNEKDKSKVHYITEQMAKFLVLKEAILRHERSKDMPAGWEWRGRALRVDQQRVIEDREFYNTLKKALTAIGDLYKEVNDVTTLPTVFMMYAWPTDENKPRENWVKPFLVELKRALEWVGFQAVLDIRNVDMGDDSRIYMNQVKDYEYTLLFCTPSLKTKLNDSKYHAVKIEMSKTILKFNEDIAFTGERRILPLILEGINGDNYPDEFNLYKIVFDCRDRSYVNNLKSLLRRMLGPAILASDKFQEAWSPIESSCYVERVTEEGYRHAMEGKLTSIKSASSSEVTHSSLSEFSGKMRKQGLFGKHDPRLSKEILFLIFGYLDSATFNKTVWLVCWNWSLVWKEYNLKYKMNGINSGQLSRNRDVGKRKNNSSLIMDELLTVVKDVVVKERMTLNVLLELLRDPTGKEKLTEKASHFQMALTEALSQQIVFGIDAKKLSEILSNALGCEVVEIFGEAEIQRVGQEIISEIYSDDKERTIELDEERCQALESRTELKIDRTDRECRLRIPTDLPDSQSVREILSLFLGTDTTASSLEELTHRLANIDRVVYKGVGLKLEVEWVSSQTKVRDKGMSDRKKAIEFLIVGEYLRNKKESINSFFMRVAIQRNRNYLNGRNRADCNGIDLSVGSYPPADYSKANFSYADFSYVNFFGATMKAIKLTETDLEGADIRCVKRLSRDALKSALFLNLHTDKKKHLKIVAGRKQKLLAVKKHQKVRLEKQDFRSGDTKDAEGKMDFIKNIISLLDSDSVSRLRFGSS